MRTGLRAVEIEGHVVDVLLDGDLVAAIGTDVLSTADEIVDGDGGALLPGLHDHHVHLLAMAARRAGPDLDGVDGVEAADGLLRAAVRAERTRVGGYDEHRHGPMDRMRLDRVGEGAVLRVQHRTGLSWVLSSSALHRVEATSGLGSSSIERDEHGRPTGWIHRDDALLLSVFGPNAPDLAPVGRELARVGITGVTDATHALGPRIDVLRSARASDALPQHLVLLGIDAPVDDLASMGPAKMLVDEMLDLDPSSLAEAIASVHARGRAVALHAVSRAECVLAVTALREAGAFPGDRIEHGSVLPTELDGLLVAAGIAVVVQPSLVRERGDGYLATVDPDDLAHLHRAASLLRAGVTVSVGSDAPVTTIDPWAAIATAADRRTRLGEVLGGDEAVPARVALGWYLADPLDLARPRRIAVGARADLCLLSVPLEVALARPSSQDVRATWVAGRLVAP